jgi:hypothetical protein
MKKTIKIINIFLPIVLMFLLSANNLFASVMSSSNYQIQSDSLTTGGGDWSSVSYIFRDTFGEVSTGPATSTSYAMRAGWQEMQETYISVSSPGNVAMTPSIPGVSGGTASGTAFFNVITDNMAGFTMGANASTAHAMVASGDATYYFSNYPSTPSYNWSVASGQAQFGFTVEPQTSSDAMQIFLDNSSNACNISGGTYHVDRCWVGFDGTNSSTLINRTTRTDETGENEAIKFQAQSNGAFLKNGTYQATVTATISSN